MASYIRFRQFAAKATFQAALDALPSSTILAGDLCFIHDTQEVYLNGVYYTSNSALFNHAITAGAGLVGGGAMNADVSLSIASPNSSLTITDDGVDINAAQNLLGASTTAAPSVKAVKDVTDTLALKAIKVVSGAGLSSVDQTLGSDLELTVGAGDGIQVDADSVTVKLDGVSLAKGSSGLKVDVITDLVTELNAATKTASATAVKSYVDAKVLMLQNQITGSLHYVGTWDGTKTVAQNLAAHPTFTSGQIGDFFRVNAEGSASGTFLEIGDDIILKVDVANTATDLDITDFDIIPLAYDTDTVLLNNVQTLTNKTFDGGAVANNTFTNIPQDSIKDLGTALSSKLDDTQLNTGTLSTTATDKMPSEKTVSDAISSAITTSEAAADLAYVKKSTVLTAGNGLTSTGNLTDGQSFNVETTTTNALEITANAINYKAAQTLSTSSEMSPSVDVVNTALGYKAEKSRSINAGNGFTAGSGGTLEADRSFTIGAANGITVSTNAVGVNLGSGDSLAFDGTALIVNVAPNLGTLSSTKAASVNAVLDALTWNVQ